MFLCLIKGLGWNKFCINFVILRFPWTWNLLPINCDGIFIERRWFRIIIRNFIDKQIILVLFLLKYVDVLSLAKRGKRGTFSSRIKYWLVEILQSYKFSFCTYYIISNLVQKKSFLHRYKLIGRRSVGRTPTRVDEMIMMIMMTHKRWHFYASEY